MAFNTVQFFSVNGKVVFAVAICSDKVYIFIDDKDDDAMDTN